MLSDFNFIEAIDEESKEATIRLDGTLGYDISGRDVAQEINYLDTVMRVNKIHFMMNSGGGKVSDSLSIVSAILACNAETHGYNEGTVMSAMFHTFLSCDILHAKDYSIFMYHEARYKGVDEKDIPKEAKEALKMTNEGMATLIANRLGKEQGEVAEMLKDESYFMATKFEERLGFPIEIQSTKRKPAITNSMSLEEIVAELESFNTNLKSEEMSDTKFDITSILAEMEISADVENPIEAISAKFKSLTSQMEKKDEKIGEMEETLKGYAGQEAEAYIDSLIAEDKLKKESRDAMIEAYKNNKEVVVATFSAIPEAKVVETIEDPKLERNEPDAGAKFEIEMAKDEDGEEYAKDYRWYTEHASDELKLMMREEPQKYEFLLNEYMKG